MDLTNVRTVAVVGAGEAGLATARTLLAAGYRCTVFERGDRVGGVWTTGYLEFGIQVQRELYEYPDWPHAADTPDFTPGPQVQAYLEGYAERYQPPKHRDDRAVIEIDVDRILGRG